MHPMAFAAWFGLLATALNLFPISQLDGGHISYAVLGRQSTWVTFLMIAVAIGLTFVSLELAGLDGAAGDHDRWCSARITRRPSTNTNRSTAGDCSSRASRC